MARYIDAENAKIDADERGFDFWTTDTDIDNVQKFLDEQPTTDVVEVKRGEWVENEKGMIVTSYKCSLCGRIVRDDTGYDVVKDYPYCHCGAKMDGKE